MSLIIKTTWAIRDGRTVEAVAAAGEGVALLQSSGETRSARAFVSQFGDIPWTVLVIVDVADWEAFARLQTFLHRDPWRSFFVPHVSGPSSSVEMLSNAVYEEID